MSKTINQMTDDEIREKIKEFEKELDIRTTKRIERRNKKLNNSVSDNIGVGASKCENNLFKYEKKNTPKNDDADVYYRGNNSDYYKVTAIDGDVCKTIRVVDKTTEEPRFSVVRSIEYSCPVLTSVLNRYNKTTKEEFDYHFNKVYKTRRKPLSFADFIFNNGIFNPFYYI